MNWLQVVGDADILRDATRASAVFWYRARQARLRVGIAGGFTLLLILIGALLTLGPEGTGVVWLRREWVGPLLAVFALAWLGYVGWAIFDFMPTRNDRIVLGLRQFVRTQIDPLEDGVRALRDEQLLAKTAELKQRLADGESIDTIRPEAYACVREASRRAREHRQFECQLIGGKVLEDCNVAEMRTGEGKTIVCYMAAYMKVLQGLKVHMVTVNDYLVKRDAEFAKSIFDRLNVVVGYISSDMETHGPGAAVRREGYECDITYGTNSEFGFDYLRDNMKLSPRDQMQGKQDYVVVDEVDSILIDEARTPLIISGPAHDDVSNYRTADNVARSLITKQEQENRATRQRLDDIQANPARYGLDPNEPKYADGIKKFRTNPYWLSSDEGEAIGHKQYFIVEEDRKSAHMTEHGARAAQQELGIGTFYDRANMNWPHYIDNALRSHMVYRRDKEYVVQEDQIVIVDEFTGRLMQGRQWSDGLHQAVEAKERVTIKQETQTLATITLQNLFKLYQQLAGMTGTALTEAEEFMKIYKLDVVAIPTNKPVRRIDYNDKIYKTLPNKYEALVEEIRSQSQDGFPSDPWSQMDMLKLADRTLRAVQAATEDAEKTPEHERIPQQLETIAAALKAFNGGSGDEEALARGYRDLMGDALSGRPVLVGTVSVENSEKLSQALQRRYGIEHEVLNAKNHAREAEIVTKAGQQTEVARGKQKLMAGNVTISTNMAGRGTDIRLGPGVAEAGGLHVVGTERHESRRIDNQLRGRCGRQGDPGSSRFFLSFDDELLRLFMGEWVLKMLSAMGFEEGMAIDDKNVNRGIARAQKKVEERNFNIRKNLLEYDEIMDHQRKEFYGLRQRVVEGRGLSDLIWEMIDQTVADAIERYFDRQYPAQCVVEWVSQNMGVHLEAEKLDTSELENLTRQVRDLAGYEARQEIQQTFGEYVDADLPAEEWDIRGLVRWASQYGLSLTQNQVRSSDPHALEDQIIEAALQRINEQDLTALGVFVEPQFARGRLAQWAREKYGVEIPPDELAELSRADAEQMLLDRMRAIYRQREIEYPPETMISYALKEGGTNANEVARYIAAWVNRKYRTGQSYEHFAGRDPHDVYDEIRKLNENALTNGVLESEIEQAVQTHRDGELTAWARERFGIVMQGRELDPHNDPKTQLRDAAYQMLRFELTQLERYVVLVTLDGAWKDHMYGMQLLRDSIGLRGYAEQDPKIAYKREGTRMFNEMLESVRERVSDMVFKVKMHGYGVAAYAWRDDIQVAGFEAISDSAYRGATASKADATGAGFSGAGEDQEAAMRQQGEGGQPQTIRRAMPKVGRNDPCPCGSGKKYKKCHGQGAA